MKRSCEQLSTKMEHLMSPYPSIVSRWRWTVAIAATALVTSIASAAAQERFYKGKTISLIIASNASGGYDTYGRLLSRHLGAYLDGHPGIVVQNMPGAGGIRAANQVYNVVPKDGTVIGIFDQAVFLNQLLGVSGLRADVAKFNWIGRMIGNSAVLFAWHTAAVKKIQDAFTHELIVAASGSPARVHRTGPKHPPATKT